MSSCSCSRSYSLVHCSVLSVSVTASVQYLIPSSSYSLALFMCFPPSLSFINDGEKKWGRMLWRYSKGADECWQRQKREMKRGKVRGGRDTQREKMRYDVPLQCQLKKICILLKEVWELLKTKGHFEGCSLKLIICSQSKLSASLFMWHTGLSSKYAWGFTVT